jgi:UDP-MurNAc hydroxylase
MLGVIRPRLTVPFGGPPCFLDPALAGFNRWMATPDVIPSPPQAQAWLREHDVDLACTTLLPGDRCHPRAQLVLADSRWQDFSYDDLGRYVRSYAHERAVELSRLHVAHPEPDDSLGERFTAHFEHLAGLSRYFLERISMIVRFDVIGRGGGRWDVHLFPDAARVDLDGRAPEVQYRFRVRSRWLAAVVDGVARWDDLLNSMRFLVEREPDAPSDHLFWLLRHADRDALLSIEAYERSHALTRGGERRLGDHLSEHAGEEADEPYEPYELDELRRSAGARGSQVVPPSTR